MRTSGRGRSESVLFIAPAAIFASFFVWMYGGPADTAAMLDRVVLNGVYRALSVCQAVIASVMK